MLKEIPNAQCWVLVNHRKQTGEIAGTGHRNGPITGPGGDPIIPRHLKACKIPKGLPAVGIRTTRFPNGLTQFTKNKGQRQSANRRKPPPQKADVPIKGYGGRQ